MRTFLAAIFAMAIVACDDEVSSSGPAPLPLGADPSPDLSAHLRAVSACKTNDKGELDMSCPAAKAFNDWSGQNVAWIDDSPEAVIAAAAPFRQDASSAVRSVLVRLYGRFVKSKNALAKKELIELFARERDAGVARQIVLAVTQDSRDPELRALLVGALASEAELVRRAAATGLANKLELPTGKEREAVLKALKSDPAIPVREALCLALGVGEDEEMLAAYDAILDDPATPPELYDTCLQGLTLAWSLTALKSRSKGAYERSMRRLETGPRDDRHPMGSAIGDVAFAKPETVPFFERPRAIAALRALLADKAAAEDTRGAAASALMMMAPEANGELGVPLDEARALIEKRAKRLEAASKK